MTTNQMAKMLQKTNKQRENRRKPQMHFKQKSTIITAIKTIHWSIIRIYYEYYSNYYYYYCYKLNTDESMECKIAENATKRNFMTPSPKQTYKQNETKASQQSNYNLRYARRCLANATYCFPFYFIHLIFHISRLILFSHLQFGFIIGTLVAFLRHSFNSLRFK